MNKEPIGPFIASYEHFAREYGHSLDELAKILKRDESSLCRSSQRFVQKCSSNEMIQTQYKLLKQTLLSYAIMQD